MDNLTPIFKAHSIYLILIMIASHIDQYLIQYATQYTLFVKNDKQLNYCEITLKFIWPNCHFTSIFSVDTAKFFHRAFAL